MGCGSVGRYGTLLGWEGMFILTSGFGLNWGLGRKENDRMLML